MEGDSRGKDKKMNRTSLPDDIVFDILSRLPVQSLLQFKSVCKSWLSIITHPHFIKAHLLRSAQSPSSRARLLLKPNSCPDPLSFLSFDFEAPNSRTKNLRCPTNYSGYSCLHPMCSCDGLILLWACNPLSVGTYYQSFVLWNPTIRSYRKITCPYELLVLGYYGLFHDSKADDYRVLLVSQEWDTSVMVYSSRDDSWEIFVDDRYGVSVWECQTAVVNGFVHWVMYSRELCSCVIVYFDLVEGKFKEVPLPSFWNKDDQIDLVVMGEFLCVYNGDLGLGQIKIYAMKEYRKKESWTRLFVMPRVVKRNTLTAVKPLCRTKKGQVVVSVGINGVGLYDPKVHKFLWCNLYGGRIIAIPYVETLVSMKMNRPNLPDDIVFDILSRLPVQSLLQFKSVCKSWLSIITHPLFIKAHLLRSAQSPSSRARVLLKSLTCPDPLSFLSFDFEAPDSRSKNLRCLTNYSEYSCLRPMCSCDGLILLSANNTLPIGTSCKSFVLWNPTIRSYRRITCPYKLPFRGNYGFFHDSTADDYRVLVVTQESETETSVVVYSSRDDSWEFFVDDRYALSACGYRAAVVNGFVHWVMRSRDLGSCVIVYFDLVEGKFKELPLPSIWNKDDSKMDLVVLGEFLCVYNCDFGVELKIYAMKEYRKKESWTRLFVMPWAIDGTLATSVKPLGRTKKGQVLVSVGYGVGLYDPKVRKFVRCNLYSGMMAIPYVETLVSLHGGV